MSLTMCENQSICHAQQTYMHLIFLDLRRYAIVVEIFNIILDIHIILLYSVTRTHDTNIS